jgi:hypothetical protein
VSLVMGCEGCVLSSEDHFRKVFHSSRFGSWVTGPSHGRPLGPGGGEPWVAHRDLRFNPNAVIIVRSRHARAMAKGFESFSIGRYRYEVRLS